MIKNEIDLNIRKKIMLSILDEYHNFCVINNLKYSIWFGTAIGAVRHGGFIPWDDDIDVVMPREDYDKFLTLYKDNDQFVLYTDRRKDYKIPFAKLCSNETYNKSIFYKDTHGVFIDIFPLEKISNIDFPYEKVDKISSGFRMFSYKISIKNVQRNFGNKKFKFLRRIKSFLFIFTLPIKRSLFPYRYWQKKYLKLLDEISGNEFYHVVYYAHKKDKNLDIDCFDKRFLINFENKKYFIFKDYDKYLTNEYGNYHELPPNDKRTNHSTYNFYFKRDK